MTSKRGKQFVDIRRHFERPLRVVILTTPDAQPLDIACPYEVFAIVKRKLRELGDDSGRGYEVEVLNIGTKSYVTGSLGLSIAVHGSYHAAHGSIDTLIVAGGFDPWSPSTRKDTQAIAWLRRQASNARRILGICTGAFVLAEAGLLDGKRATTHWYFCQQLAARFPKIKVDSNPLFVRDGNIYTCAGVTSGMDLALALVEEDFGTEVALRIARAYVMFLRRPGGQSQFSTPLSFAASSASPWNRLQIWILDHLHEKLTISRMAAQTKMSPRNFARMFKQELQMTPAEYVETVRVDAAKKQIEETNEGVAMIASAVGFGSARTMRRAFLRTLTVTPLDYRQRIHAEGPTR